MLRVQHHKGLAWYTFTGPDRTFKHALVTRLGGASRPPFVSLNLGSTVGDSPTAVAENHQRLFSALDINPRQAVSPHQIHSRHVAWVKPSDAGTIIPETDALITNSPDLVLLLRFADCTPVLFYDPMRQAVGLAHAGWRGVVAGVVPATVQAMERAFGTDPSDLWAGIGPAIGPDHYEVGPEVVEAIDVALPAGVTASAWREERWYLDMPGAVAAQLIASGVTRIERANICTACHMDEWYSHRAERGQTGRFGVLVMLEKQAKT